MACRHGDYEGVVCAHCGLDAAQKRRELAERLWYAAWQECEEGRNGSGAIVAIERVLAEQEKPLKRAICMKCKAKGEYLDLSADACKSCGTVGRLAPLISVVFEPDESKEDKKGEK